MKERLLLKLTAIQARSRGTLIITTVLIAMTASGVALTLSAGANNNRAAVNAGVPEPPSASAMAGPIAPLGQSSFPGERPQVLLITLRPWGFEPSAITKSHSRLVLRVDNRSGLREMSLQLDRWGGNRVKEVRIPFQKLDWSEEVELPPGQYELREANHPDWTCGITITPR